LYSLLSIDKLESLNERNVHPLLVFLLKRGKAKKSDLSPVISNPYKLTDLLNKLSTDGLLTIEESKFGRKSYEISLTPKGRQVAEQFKRAEEAAKGVIVHENEGRVEIPEGSAEDWAARFTEATRGMSLLYHVNVFEDHVTIGQEKDGKTHIINIYVKVNGKGIMRLWCEEDESFDCIHTQYAWSLPKVQEMYANNVKNGKVNGK